MHTVIKAEHALYNTLLSWAEHCPAINAWLACLPEWLTHIKDKKRYANAPYYASLVQKLPPIVAHDYTLDSRNVSAWVHLSPHERKAVQALLKGLMPWRKGGFYIGEMEAPLHIDTEWRSDFKWDRVIPHLDLVDKRVLDVGGGSGYHGWRMLGAGGESVIVLDPSPLFYYQFMAIRHFLPELTNRFGQYPIHFLPVALENLPTSALFDTAFCMGVLYHRPSPLDCLIQLKNQLRKGGTLVLETLVVDGDDTTVFIPKARYAMMNNVYFLPSVAALSAWLEKVGFDNVRCVDVNVTTTKEQRATEYMTYQSLQDFLDPNDPNKTVEGYPRPTRAVLLANKP